MDDTQQRSRRGRSGPAADAGRAGDSMGAAAFAIVALLALSAVLVVVRGHVDQAVVALLLGCGVALAGQVGGRSAGVAAAVAAAVGFNFFHVQPYLSMRIHDADDVWTTATLLAVGLVSGIGSDAAAGWRRRARRAADELTALERVVAAASGSTAAAAPGGVVAVATDAVTGLLGLRACRFVADVAPAGLTVLGAGGALAGDRLVYSGAGFELPESGVALAVNGGGRTVGYLECVPDTAAPSGVSLDRRRAALAVANVLGLVLAADSGASPDGGDRACNSSS